MITPPMNTTATITAWRHEPVGTPIQWPFWTWWVLEFLFGLVGFLAVFVSPADTATNFAWTIQPPVMAGLLGACYLATGVMLLGAPPPGAGRRSVPSWWRPAWSHS